MATLYGHVMLRMATLQCYAHLRAQLLTNDHQLFCVIRADNTVPSCDPCLLQTGVSVLCCEMCPVYIVFISVFFLFNFFQNSVCVCSDKCVLFFPRGHCPQWLPLAGIFIFLPGPSPGYVLFNSVQ